MIKRLISPRQEILLHLKLWNNQDTTINSPLNSKKTSSKSILWPLTNIQGELFYETKA